MNRTIQAAAAALRTGTLTPVHLLDECLACIDALEERVRAWVLVDRVRARVDAERATTELRAGQDRGPLHGIPVGIKDIIDVADWPTAAGSRRWANAVARTDAVVVTRLRDAGAVLLGKTHTTAYASFDPSPTHNPWHAERTPGGSSSGSAAAVAAGMCLATLASQTGGSTARPAGYCGVASLKPTHGQISLSGVLPLAPSLDHLGIMANCAADLALLHEVLRDPVALSARALNAPLTFGRPGGLFHDAADPIMRTLLDHVCLRAEANGIAVRPLTLPTSFAEANARQRTIMAVEAAAWHGERLARHPDDYPPNVTALLREGLATAAPELLHCHAHRSRLSTEMDAMLADGTILLTPATTEPAPLWATTGNPAFNAPWSYTGLPTVTLLAGWSADGLPLSVQLVGPHHGETLLLRAACRLEDCLAVEKRTVR